VIRVIPILTLAAVIVGGCGAFARLQMLSDPTPCAAVYDAARCDLIVDVVASRLGVERTDIRAVEIVPEPTPEVRSDGSTILMTRSGGPLLIAAATLPDGSVRTVTMCGGVATDPVCRDKPQLRTWSMTADGYRDVPCCASTPVPTADPDAVRASEALRLDRVEIPIGHAGAYEVVLGSGSLPNGILTDASFVPADPWPADVVVPSGEVFLDIRSLEPDGQPFANAYDHGWRPGVERFQAVLLFEVSRFTPGAVLIIEDVVVR
jgi:hypothetical protein